MFNYRFNTITKSVFKIPFSESFMKQNKNLIIGKLFIIFFARSFQDYHADQTYIIFKFWIEGALKRLGSTNW